MTTKSNTKKNESKEMTLKEANKTQAEQLFDKVKKIKTELNETKNKSIKKLSFGSYFNWRTYVELYHYYTKQDDIFVINMEQRNGYADTFYVYPTESYFVYKGGAYIIDDSAKYWHVGFGSYAIDYHQDISIPIIKRTKSNDVVEALEQSQDVNVGSAVNPLNLQTFIKNAVIEKVMKGEELDQFFDFAKKMLIVIAVVQVINIGIQARAMGWI